eukprot:m.463595 g.463595  ORF g.463595 m.463595 type:complete len:192 (+) comp23104_c0_seq1:160-735(+)
MASCDEAQKSLQEVPILAVQCGGAIDKDYPSTLHGYNFEVTSPAFSRVVALAMGSEPGHSTSSADTNESYPIRCVSIYDTKAEHGYDPAALTKLCADSEGRRVLVTHDLVTLSLGACRLVEALQSRGVSDVVVVFTGARVPERFRSSDAAVNIGVAIGALRSLTQPGVYIAIDCRVLPVDRALQRRSDKSP